MLGALRQDAARYRQNGGWLRSPGFWVGACYRLRVWARAQPFPPLRLALRALAWLLGLPCRLLYDVSIHAREIGPGLCLIHPRGVLIGPGVVLGAQCLVFHDVTIGTNAAVDGVPVVGDRVDIYVGARLLGPIHVGDDVMIGANCVVTRDVPAGSAALAAPGRVVSRALLRVGAPKAEAAAEPPAHLA